MNNAWDVWTFLHADVSAIHCDSSGHVSPPRFTVTFGHWTHTFARFITTSLHIHYILHSLPYAHLSLGFCRPPSRTRASRRHALFADLLCTDCTPDTTRLILARVLTTHRFHGSRGLRYHTTRLLPHGSFGFTFLHAPHLSHLSLHNASISGRQFTCTHIALRLRFLSFHYHHLTTHQTTTPDCHHSGSFKFCTFCWTAMVSFYLPFRFSCLDHSTGLWFSLVCAVLPTPPLFSCRFTASWAWLHTTVSGSCSWTFHGSGHRFLPQFLRYHYVLPPAIILYLWTSHTHGFTAPLPLFTTLHTQDHVCILPLPLSSHSSLFCMYTPRSLSLDTFGHSLLGRFVWTHPLCRFSPGFFHVIFLSCTSLSCSSSFVSLCSFLFPLFLFLHGTTSPVLCGHTLLTTRLTTVCRCTLDSRATFWDLSAPRSVHRFPSHHTGHLTDTDTDSSSHCWLHTSYRRFSPRSAVSPSARICLHTATSHHTYGSLHLILVTFFWTLPSRFHTSFLWLDTGFTSGPLCLSRCSQVTLTAGRIRQDHTVTSPRSFLSFLPGWCISVLTGSPVHISLIELPFHCAISSRHGCLCGCGRSPRPAASLFRLPHWTQHLRTTGQGTCVTPHCGTPSSRLPPPHTTIHHLFSCTCTHTILDVVTSHTVLGTGPSWTHCHTALHSCHVLPVPRSYVCHFQSICRIPHTIHA